MTEATSIRPSPYKVADKLFDLANRALGTSDRVRFTLAAQRESTMSKESRHGSAPQLSFQLMNNMLDDFMTKNSSPVAGLVERWAFRIGLVGAALGMLLGLLLSSETGRLFATIGLGVEIAGLGLSLLLTIVREWRNFRHARKTYAQELDYDYALYRDYVVELRRFPVKERVARLRYIRDRKQVMTHRMGVFTGGLEKLGIIPLLLALYIQFKDWEWGDWDALAHVNLVQGLLIWALVLCYAAGWHLVRLRSRIDAYELLLAEASHDASS